MDTTIEQGHPDGQAAASPGPGSPYVGLRPYEREEQALLFGRHRDAVLLADKIFSSRLTLFYARSGVGKSSALRALVIPRLEAAGAVVVYFDGWSLADPLAALGAAIRKAAERVGVKEVLGGAPTLEDLSRLVTTSRGRPTLVLVLDQFEELLRRQEEQIGPVRTELGELGRAVELDARIVLSLRQENLAGLEPFRAELVDLFRSTALLEPLGAEGVQEAIEKPVTLFGKHYEPELVTRLLQDLRTESAEGGAGPSSGLELPLLQLVCGELWAAAEARHQAALGLPLYQKLGGVKRILDDYIRRAMPASWPGQVAAARVLQLLAPPSGHKVALTADDLAHLSGVRPARVARELEALCRARILRTRRDESGEEKELYELQHDAYVKYLTPWKEAVLHLRRRLRQGAAALALAGIAAMTFVYVQTQAVTRRIVQESTSGALEHLRTLDPLPPLTASTTFDRATVLMLWSSQKEGRLDDLRKMLEKYESLLPPGYGLAQTADGEAAPEGGAWPVALRFRSGGSLDQGALQGAWKAQVRRLAERGVPVPPRVDLVDDSTLPAGRVVLELRGPPGQQAPPLLQPGGPLNPREPGKGRLSSTGVQPRAGSNPRIVFDGVTAPPLSTFISSRRLEGAPKEFFEKYRDEWTRVGGSTGEPTPGGDESAWWLVPRWSIPVWKVGGRPVNDAAWLPVFVGARHLRRHPELLLRGGAADVVLSRAADRDRVAVDEARAARGPALLDDLTACVAARPDCLADPLFLLEALAEHPGQGTPEVVAALAGPGPGAPLAGPRLNGPWKGKPPEALAPTLPGWQEASAMLPPLEPPVRVILGEALSKELLGTPDDAADAAERLAEICDEAQRVLGVEVPLASLQRAPVTAPLGPRDFVVAVGYGPGAAAAAAKAGPEAPITAIAEALRARIEARRAALVTAGATGEVVGRMGPAVQAWLKAEFSTTDLKLLLRAASADPLKGPGSPRGGGAWLLRSLPFWTAIEKKLDGPALARRLAETQVALSSTPSNAAGSAPVPVPVPVGLEALQAGRLAEAQRTFARAWIASPEAAVRSLLVGYPSTARAIWRSEIRAVCRDPRARLSRGQRIDLEQDLAAEASGLPPSERRVLQGCAIVSAEPARRKHRARLVEAFLADDATALEAPDAVIAIATKVIGDFDPRAGDRTLQLRAFQQLGQALARVGEAAASQAFNFALGVCQREGPRNWCWDGVSSIARTSRSYPVLIELARQLTNSMRRSDFDLAVELARRARASAPAEFGGAPRAALEARADLIGLVARVQLVPLGDLGQAAPLHERLRPFLLDRGELGPVASSAELTLLFAEERADEAASQLEAARGAWPGAGFVPERFLLALLQRDRAGLERLSRDPAVADASEGDYRHLGAIASILGAPAGGDHLVADLLRQASAAADYVALLAFTGAGGVVAALPETQGYLERRWSGGSVRASWPARAALGDDGVWRERLIGYTLGHLRRDELFTGLESREAFRTSDLAALRADRDGLQTEAEFYAGLLAGMNGDEAARQAAMLHVRKLHRRDYLEWAMAGYLRSP